MEYIFNPLCSVPKASKMLCEINANEPEKIFQPVISSLQHSFSLIIGISQSTVVTKLV